MKIIPCLPAGPRDSIDDMNKKILLGAAPIILIGLGSWMLLRTSPVPSPIPAPASESEADVRSAAWQTFSAYLTALQKHDIQAIRGLSYQMSDLCSDSKKRAQCFAVMDRVASSTAVFKESDFTHISFDNKQVILTSDWRFEETDIAVAEARKEMYFIRDDSGALKLLFMSQPEGLVWSFIDPKQSRADLVRRLNERITDTDGDFAQDEVETCTFAGAASSTPACVSTDPNTKDTDGDGIWDGLEMFIR